VQRRGLDFFQNKYGMEDGFIVWQDRQETWQATMNAKSPEEMAEINKKKNVHNLDNLIRIHGEEEGLKQFYKNQSHAKNLSQYTACGVSKESIKVFNQLNIYLADKISADLIREARYGAGQEIGIPHENGKLYRYDYCIERAKILIEYHGVFWHSSREVKQTDQLKRELAAEKGYTLFEIWSFATDEEKLNIFQQVESQINRNIHELNQH